MPATPASPPSIDVRSSPSSHRANVGLEIGLIVVAILLLVIGAVFLVFYLRQRRSNAIQSATHTHRSLFSKTSSPSTHPDTPDSPAYSLADGQTPRYSTYTTNPLSVCFSLTWMMHRTRPRLPHAHRTPGLGWLMEIARSRRTVQTIRRLRRFTLTFLIHIPVRHPSLHSRLRRKRRNTLGHERIQRL